jgi:hypothetical protein
MPTVVLGAGSFYVEYEDLIKAGLFELYPGLDRASQGRRMYEGEENSGGGRVKWYSAVKRLWEHGFKDIKALKVDEVKIAGRLVQTLRQPATGKAGHMSLEMLVWFLALEKRGFDNRILCRMITEVLALSGEEAKDLVVEDMGGQDAMRPGTWKDAGSVVSGKDAVIDLNPEDEEDLVAEDGIDLAQDSASDRTSGELMSGTDDTFSKELPEVTQWTALIWSFRHPGVRNLDVGRLDASLEHQCKASYKRRPRREGRVHGKWRDYASPRLDRVQGDESRVKRWLTRTRWRYSEDDREKSYKSPRITDLGRKGS